MIYPVEFKPAILAVCLTSTLIVTGCGRFPYRMPIQQGNVITQELVDQLSLGMEKRQVLLALGTPLLVDTFNQDRWDYLYTLAERGELQERRTLTLFFEAERLVRLDGDFALSQSERRPDARAERVVVVPPVKKRSGIIGALTPDFLRTRKRERAQAESTAGPQEELENKPALEEN